MDMKVYVDGEYSYSLTELGQVFNLISAERKRARYRICLSDGKVHLDTPKPGQDVDSPCEKRESIA